MPFAFLLPAFLQAPGPGLEHRDLADERTLQVVVDREPGQYLGHPTTVLLEDGRTILCAYPQGHGEGPIRLRRSPDAGRTWSEPLAVPESFATSLETPTIHRLRGADGVERLILWSGLHPARLAVSEDDGESWSELAPAGDWGGIVVMGDVEPLRTPGHYLAMFHDDGRFFAPSPTRTDPVTFTLYRTRSTDGGLTWAEPEVVLARSDVHLCEPGCLRSPDGTRLVALLRENSRTRRSFRITSTDEGATWTEPTELPPELTGDRHVPVYLPDGRVFVSLRDMAEGSPTRGDWVAWVGSYDALLGEGTGELFLRLMDNTDPWDCGYAGVEVLADGTVVTTSYGHWTEGEPPYVVCVRIPPERLSSTD